MKLISLLDGKGRGMEWNEQLQLQSLDGAGVYYELRRCLLLRSS
jgi:hypothetical protein